MAWEVVIDPVLHGELGELPAAVQRALAARVKLLAQFGPTLGRPTVDTLKGSRHANMKELRFEADRGVWRVAFAFDSARRCVLLAAGNKAGVSERRFYRQLIDLADRRFDARWVDSR